MAVIKAAARLIIREHARLHLKGPALCLGVPDIYLTRRELSSAIGGRDDDRSFVTSTEFLAALGIRDATSVDIPGSVHAPDRIHDLNTALPDDLRDRFDLVIDPGTTEHVFDVKASLANIVSALRVGGVVIHFVPIYSYNGGYFSINPSVLHDFYEANGFSDIRGYLLMWDRYRPFSGRTRCYPYGPAMEGRHALADHDQCRFTPHLLLFARKANAVDEVRVPIQHEHQGSARPRLIGKLLRRILPGPVATYVSAAARRELQLLRSRRTSFWI